MWDVSRREPRQELPAFERGSGSGGLAVPPKRTWRKYQSHAAKGWGVIAQQLGIEPGSAAFHALKRGDLRFGAPPASHGDDDGPGHRHGNGKGRPGG